jgi:hypothetical protein
MKYPPWAPFQGKPAWQDTIPDAVSINSHSEALRPATLNHETKDRHACNVVVLFLGWAVARASPEGDGWEVMGGCTKWVQNRSFLYASETLACGGSD